MTLYWSDLWIMAAYVVVPTLIWIDCELQYRRMTWTPNGESNDDK